MANTFKNFFSKDVSSNTVVYTAAAATQTTVIGMTIANVLTSPVTANIVINSGGTDFFMLKEATIPAGGALVPVGGEQKLVLEATDSLAISATGNCDVILSVLEIT
jgi:hypothetical protein